MFHPIYEGGDRHLDGYPANLQLETPGDYLEAVQLEVLEGADSNQPISSLHDNRTTWPFQEDILCDVDAGQKQPLPPTPWTTRLPIVFVNCLPSLDTTLHQQ